MTCPCTIWTVKIEDLWRDFLFRFKFKSEIIAFQQRMTSMENANLQNREEPTKSDTGALSKLSIECVIISILILSFCMYNIRVSIYERLMPFSWMHLHNGETQRRKTTKNKQKINFAKAKSQEKEHASEWERNAEKTTHKHTYWSIKILHSKFANSPCKWLRTVRNKEREFFSNRFNCLGLFNVHALASCWHLGCEHKYG